MFGGYVSYVVKMGELDCSWVLLVVMENWLMYLSEWVFFFLGFVSLVVVLKILLYLVDSCCLYIVKNNMYILFFWMLV